MDIKKIRIGNRWVGNGEPCFIIAEAGSNHDGKFSQAKRLIDIAKESGADAIKFQTFSAEKLSIPNSPDFEILKKAEFPRQWHKGLSKYCREKNIIFLSTPFDFEAIDILKEVNVSAYKISSGDITYYPMLKYVAKTKKPIILSTGKSSMEDVDGAVEYLKRHGAKGIIILHCVASYPTDISEVNLSVIPEMKKRFNIPVGFSDHTMNPLIPAFSVCYGANVIEKHITPNRNLSGPDHSFAMNPEEFKQLVVNIRIAEQTKGSGKKEPSKSEKRHLLTGRRGIFVTADIKKGTVITEKLIMCVRPMMAEKNISAKDYEKLIGKKAKRDIKKYSPLKKDDVDI